MSYGAAVREDAYHGPGGVLPGLFSRLPGQHLATGERAMILIIAADQAPGPKYFPICQGLPGLESDALADGGIREAESVDLANTVTIQVRLSCLSAQSGVSRRRR